MQKEDKHVRVQGEALIASTPTEPGYVIYLDTLRAWEAAPEVALTEAEKQEVVSAIKKTFSRSRLRCRV